MTIQATFFATLNATLLSYLHDIQNETNPRYTIQTVQRILYISLVISATATGTAGTSMAWCQRRGSLSDRRVSSQGVIYFQWYVVLHMVGMVANVYLSLTAIIILACIFIPYPVFVAFFIFLFLLVFLTPWSKQNTGEASQV
jgi:hypothetical protein